MTNRPFVRGLRAAAALVAFAGLAACDDDGTGSGDRLTSEDVSAIYRVCQLTFDPAGSVLPAVDIRAAAFELPGTADDPRIGLDANPQTVELTYIPKGQVNDQEIRGSYTLRGSNTVEIRFNATGVDPKTLLIPDNRGLDFEYQETPLRLSLGASTQYTVTRAAYVALSGEEPQNLPEQITGVLVGQLRTDPCS